MGIFDFFKKKSPTEEEQFLVVMIMQKISMIFEEYTSKAEALEQLGRLQEAAQKYNEAITEVQKLIDDHPNNYQYKVAFGGFVMNLGYTVDKNYFLIAENIYKKILGVHSNDKNADLTETYWKLGLIQERYYENNSNAMSYYELALKAPKGNTIQDKHKNNDLSNVYLSIALLLSNTNVDLAKEYASKRLKIVPNCPHAKSILTMRTNSGTRFYLAD
jgi:tetratricopeptide (TPR) repeat protein